MMCVSRKFRKGPWLLVMVTLAASAMLVACAPQSASNSMTRGEPAATSSAELAHNPIATWLPSPNFDQRKPFMIVIHFTQRSEEHTSELQSRGHLVCRLL